MQNTTKQSEKTRSRCKQQSHYSQLTPKVLCWYYCLVAFCWRISLCCLRSAVATHQSTAWFVSLDTRMLVRAENEHKARELRSDRDRAREKHTKIITFRSDFHTLPSSTLGVHTCWWCWGWVDEHAWRSSVGDCSGFPPDNEHNKARWSRKYRIGPMYRLFVRGSFVFLLSWPFCGWDWRVLRTRVFGAGGKAIRLSEIYG